MQAQHELSSELETANSNLQTQRAEHAREKETYMREAEEKSQRMFITINAYRFDLDVHFSFPHHNFVFNTTPNGATLQVNQSTYKTKFRHSTHACTSYKNKMPVYQSI